MSATERWIIGVGVSIVVALTAHNFLTMAELQTRVARIDANQVWMIEAIKETAGLLRQHMMREDESNPRHGP